jgi:hypothetical protein
VGNRDLVEGRSPQTARPRAQDDEKRDFRLSVSHLGPAEDGALRQVVLEDMTEEHRARSEARAWAGELLRAQEDERRRIAQDIHDDPLQRLMLLARQMAGLAPPAAPGRRRTARSSEGIIARANGCTSARIGTGACSRDRRSGDRKNVSGARRLRGRTQSRTPRIGPRLAPVLDLAEDGEPSQRREHCDPYPDAPPRRLGLPSVTHSVDSDWGCLNEVRGSSAA